VERQKKRVVHYLNQFFGQEGGEEKANIGFLVKDYAVGPGKYLEQQFGEGYNVVGTIICGDNYFNENVEKAIIEGIKEISFLKPDLFIAGPAFHAGRYGIACASLASAVQEKLGIPAITAMFPENPAVDIYRKSIYIVKTGPHAADMGGAIKTITKIGQKLINGEEIGDPESEGYIARGFVKNVLSKKTGAERAIDTLLAKVRNEQFQTELELTNYEMIDPATKITNIKNATIALVSDGGLVPKGNPDHLKVSQNTVFAIYNIDEFLAAPYQIAHSGYHHSHIIENINRLLPVDVLREMVKTGAIGNLLPEFYSTSGNTTTVAVSKRMGEGIAQSLKGKNVRGVILTST